MQKRGQITIFIVVGIFIVATIILVAVLKGGTIKTAIESQLGTSGTFNDKVKAVEDNVQSCLNLGMRETFSRLANAKSKDYQDEFAKVLETNMIGCLNFSGIDAEVIYGPSLGSYDLGDFTITYGAGNSLIKATANMDIVVKDEKNTAKIKDFYSELSIIPEDCIPAEVDGDCLVEDAVRMVSWGRIYNLEKGDSLKAGGVCLAC
ncbi:MAG: hypothetical protein AABY09_04070 [Nanoarchaeota archaeon]